MSNISSDRVYWLCQTSSCISINPTALTDDNGFNITSGPVSNNTVKFRFWSSGTNPSHTSICSSFGNQPWCIGPIDNSTTSTSFRLYQNRRPTDWQNWLVQPLNGTDPINTNITINDSSITATDDTVTTSNDNQLWQLNDVGSIFDDFGIDSIVPDTVKPPTYNHRGLSGGAIAGIVIGVVVAILLIAMAGLCLFRRRMRQRRGMEIRESQGEVTTINHHHHHHHPVRESQQPHEADSPVDSIGSDEQTLKGKEIEDGVYEKPVLESSPTELRGRQLLEKPVLESSPTELAGDWQFPPACGDQKGG